MAVKVKIKEKKNTKNFMGLLSMNRQKIEVGTVTNYSIGKFNIFGLSEVLDKGGSAGRNRSVHISGWGYNEKAFNEFKPMAKKLFLKGVKKIVAGKWSVSAMTNEIGIKACTKYKSKIEAIKSPPNAPSTIARKGFNNPMIETGKFKLNIAAKINGNRIVGRGLG